MDRSGSKWQAGSGKTALGDVRFGSKVDMNRSNRNVRFTPKSGH
jgi:hypothetical protein